MADTESPRHKLPYLSVAQAYKEVTHNEALVRIDALLHPVVEAALSTPPVVAAIDAGKCWLIAAGASAEWQGQDNKIALWTGGSWRFQIPSEGMRVRHRQSASEIVWKTNNWVAAPSIADPQSGTVIDVEARAAIAALLSHFKTIGVVTN